MIRKSITRRLTLLFGGVSSVDFLAACRTQDDAAATVGERAIFAAFSLHMPDMRVEIVKICFRSPIVSIKPVFRYRTPKSERLLDRSARSGAAALLPLFELSVYVLHV